VTPAATTRPARHDPEGAPVRNTTWG
jgi:hypothetical protein